MRIKILEPLHNYLQPIVSKPSKIDGRYWVIALLLGYFCLLFISSFFMDYTEFWGKLGVPSIHPSFFDLREVLTGFDYTRLGYDVFVDFPGAHDPQSTIGKRMPYPRTWWMLTGLGLGENHTIILGVLFIVLFYLVTLTIIGKLNFQESIIYGLIFCSPPIMLLMERGNVDIFIYLLLALVVKIVSKTNRLFIKTIAYSILWYCAILKLYAIFGLTIILRERKKICLILGSVFIAAFLIYYFSNLEELREISQIFKKFNATNGYTFGYKSIFYTINQLSDSKWLHANLLQRRRQMILPIFFLILSLFYFFIASRIILHCLLKNKAILGKLDLKQEQNKINGIDLDYFRLGATIYIGIFLLGTVWDTKLAFLIFTVPQLLNWIKSDNELSPLSSLALVSIIATLYFSPFFYSWGIDEVINLFLLVFLMYSLALTFPQWRKLSVVPI